MASNHSLFYHKNNDQPKFPFSENNPTDLVDDDDDCIICSKSLLNHTEEDADECYSTLIKKQIFRKELARKSSGGT